jgi:hypothetical protein
MEPPYAKLISGEMKGSRALKLELCMYYSLYLRRIWKVIVLVIVMIVYGQPGFGADVLFRWAILADFGDGMKGLDFSESPAVRSGTALQIYLEHLENCHIYLFLLDSNDELTPLYPVDKGYYNYGFPRGPKYIPPGTQSFTFVPPPGIERFYLIGSAERLFQIERLTEEFLQNPGHLGQQKLLLDEIESMMKGKEKKSERSEDNVTVDKKVKTDQGITKTSFRAVEVDIADFYGRKLLLDHK